MEQLIKKNHLFEGNMIIFDELFNELPLPWNNSSKRIMLPSYNPSKMEQETTQCVYEEHLCAEKRRSE